MRAEDRDPAARFFEALQEKGYDPLLARREGTLRVALTDEQRHWFVAIDDGRVAVSHRNARADATVRMSRVLLDELVTGRANAMAATLRGVIEIEGDLSLVMLFQRLFPGPPRGGKR